MERTKYERATMKLKPKIPKCMCLFIVGINFWRLVNLQTSISTSLRPTPFIHEYITFRYTVHGALYTRADVTYFLPSTLPIHMLNIKARDWSCITEQKIYTGMSRRPSMAYTFIILPGYSVHVSHNMNTPVDIIRRVTTFRPILLLLLLLLLMSYPIRYLQWKEHWT